MRFRLRVWLHGEEGEWYSDSVEEVLDIVEKTIRSDSGASIEIVDMGAK